MIEIIQTKNGADFAVAALLMSRSEPWITLERNYEKCLQSLQGDFKEVYVVRSQNEFVGFVVLQMAGTFRGYIQTICIKQDFRNKGIGAMVLKFCENRIFKMSANVFMCVSSFNYKAQELYRKLGYEQVGELKDFIIRGHAEILLRKSISTINEFKPELY